MLISFLDKSLNVLTKVEHVDFIFGLKFECSPTKFCLNMSIENTYLEGVVVVEESYFDLLFDGKNLNEFEGNDFSIGIH